MSITDLSADALSLALHARELSCREVMHAYLTRIHALNPRHQAMVSLQSSESVLQQADARDAQLARGESKGWMHGMPLAIKDLVNTAGIATTLGSPLMRNLCRSTMACWHSA